VSRKAVAIVWQSILVFAIGVNVVAVALASTGRLGPLGAAFTHQIGSFLVMLNALRLLEVEDRGVGRLRRRVGEWMNAGWLKLLGYRVKLWLSRMEPKFWFLYVVEHRQKLYRPVAAAGLVYLLLSGFYVLQPNEIGVIERFGKKMLPHKEPGLHYKLFWPIETLTRVEARRVRGVEIGFRSTNTFTEEFEPAAYEWNVQHRSGRFQRRPEESLMLSGDQNMTELTAVVHYRLAKPEDFLFRHLDGEAVVRTASESVLQGVIASSPLDEALTVKRRAIEERAKKELRERLRRYETGVEVLQVKLLDVHPSVEVVDAFRDV